MNFSITFSSENGFTNASYPYFCTPHLTMNGVIRVVHVGYTSVCRLCSCRSDRRTIDCRARVCLSVVLGAPAAAGIFYLIISSSFSNQPPTTQGLTFFPTNIPNTTVTLDLGGNPLRFISASEWNHTIAGLPRLEELNLTGTFLRSIDFDATLTPPSSSLRRLWLANNLLTEIPAVVAKMAPVLEGLSLSRNLFNADSLDWRPLLLFPQLQDLSLAGLGIRSFAPAFFDNFHELLNLDISGNLLTSVGVSFLTPKLSSLSFLAAGQAQLDATLNVTNLVSLQGYSWPADLTGCVDGFFSVGTICLRCPPGTLKLAGLGGRTSCRFCAEGTTDDDNNAATACVACGAGMFTSLGATGPCTEHLCAAGSIDDDGNAATPCVTCAAGVHVPAGQTGFCASYLCASGSTDHDADAATPCVTCSPGVYTVAGSAGDCQLWACTNGTTDDDSNPATACATCSGGYLTPAEGVGACIHEDASSDAITKMAITAAVAVTASLLVLVLLAWLLTMLYRRHQRNKPHSFKDEMEDLKNRGIYVNDPTASLIAPREIPRKCIRLLAGIGEGAFGTVYKGLIDEYNARGVPEYTVAIKVCCFFLHKIFVFF
jgi:hypothetical protein